MAHAAIESSATVIRAGFSAVFAYSVHFTRDAFAVGNPLLCELMPPTRRNRPPRVFVAADARLLSARPGLAAAIAAYCRAHALDLRGEIFRLPSGEDAKSRGFAAVLALAESALEAGIDRQSYLLAIGGGGALDAAGLAAALLHRGVRLVRLPTTVLGQNDAGVGVKNGIDCGERKNALGVFAPPWAVVDDFDFLDTLDDREFFGGFAEAVKVACIEDLPLFATLEELAPAFARRERMAVEETVRRTALRHVTHIATGGDPFETGSARPLDFGHWSAHRLEALSGYRLGHGPAVAAGVAIDSLYAASRGWITAAEAGRIVATLRTARAFEAFLPHLALLADETALLSGLEDFRAHLGGELTLTFPGPLGAHREAHAIDRPAMRDAIRRTAALLAGRE